MPSKLYVGNLAYSVSNSDLEELFSTMGQVQSVAVIMDKFTGQSKGFGFVEMTNAEDASKAIEQFNDSELKGRNIKVNEAKPRESRFGGGQPQRHPAKRRLQPRRRPPLDNLCVRADGASTCLRRDRSRRGNSLCSATAKAVTATRTSSRNI